MKEDELEQEYDRLTDEIRKAWSFPPNIPSIMHLSFVREFVLRDWEKETKKNSDDKHQFQPKE